MRITRLHVGFLFKRTKKGSGKRACWQISQKGAGSSPSNKQKGAWKFNTSAFPVNPSSPYNIVGNQQMTFWLLKAWQALGYLQQQLNGLRETVSLQPTRSPPRLARLEKAKKSSGLPAHWFWFSWQSKKILQPLCSLRQHLRSRIPIQPTRSPRGGECAIIAEMGNRPLSDISNLQLTNMAVRR